MKQKRATIKLRTLRKQLIERSSVQTKNTLFYYSLFKGQPYSLYDQGYFLIACGMNIECLVHPSQRGT